MTLTWASPPFVVGIEFCDDSRVRGAGCGGAAGSDDDCVIIVAVVVVNLV